MACKLFIAFVLITLPSDAFAAQVTVVTDPVGLLVVVDGVSRTAPYTFDWDPGSEHTISIDSPQDDPSGVRYVFSSWTDGGAQEHTITVVPESEIYTAFFRTQYSLSTSVIPPEGGSVDPPGTSWYDSGQDVPIRAMATLGYTFLEWWGDLSGPDNPGSVIMDNPKIVVAQFAPIAEVIVTPALPRGAVSGRIGNNYSFSVRGSSSNLGHSLEYRIDWGDGTFSGWSSSPTASKVWSSEGIYAVRAQARCAAHPEVISDWSAAFSVGRFAVTGQIKLAWDVPTNADGTPLTNLGGYKVHYGVFPGASGEPIDIPLAVAVTNNGAITYTLTDLGEGLTYFVTVTAYDTSNPFKESDYSNVVLGGIFAVATNPPGLQVMVDSVTYTSPQSFGWEVDSSHSLSVTSPQSGVEETRYAYHSWSDGGNQEHTITARPFLTETSEEAVLTVMNMPAEDLVGYFAFDEETGSMANDSSSYGNDASVIGGAWAEGKVRGALALDGVNAHVQIPNGPSLDFSNNQMTFAAWIYPTDLSSDYVVITQRASNDGGWFDWQIYARDIDAPTTYHPVFRVDLNGDGIIDANEEVGGDIILDPNRWYFITATYDGAQMNFYIDGTLRGTTANAGGVIPNSGRDIWIGGDEPWGEYFQGTIDEVRIYNRALNQGEIQALLAPGPAQYTLTVNVAGNGSVLKNPDNTQYSPNDNVQLTAVPAVGWRFNGWSGDLIGVKNPRNLTMNENRAVTATFIPLPAAPSITIQPANQTVIEGQAATFNVLVSGYAPLFYKWYQWDGGAWTDVYSSTTTSYTTQKSNLSDNGARLRCLVMVPAKTTYTASFTTQYSLTTGVNPSGGGVVSPSGMGWFDNGQSATLAAAGNPGYTFSGWSGDAGGTASPIPVTMDGNKTVTANFTQDQYTVTVNLSSSGVGLVSRVPDKATYVYGDQVQLTAVANPGYTFSGWSGAASGTTNPLTIMMDGSKTVTANFTQDQYNLTVSMSPAGKGSISKNPDKVTYVHGEQVQLTAVANPEYMFGGWSGAASGTTNPVTITMDGSKAVTASFTQDEYSLMVSVNPAGVGSVSKSPDKVSYVYGDQVQLTAVANPGYTFSGWSGDASGTSGQITITVDGHRAVTANFTYSLQVLLRTGCNLVSFPTIVGQTAITDLLSSIAGELKGVHAYEGCDAINPWKIHDPTLPPYGNDLQYVDSAMGIWIEVNQDVELTRQGLFSSTLSIMLCAGLNLISYAGEQAKPVAEALSSISGKYARVYSYRADDPADPWKIYDVSAPSYVNKLVTMEPGLGYWVHVNENCTPVINN